MPGRRPKIGVSRQLVRRQLLRVTFANRGDHIGVKEIQCRVVLIWQPPQHRETAAGVVLQIAFIGQIIGAAVRLRIRDQQTAAQLVGDTRDAPHVHGGQLIEALHPIGQQCATKLHRGIRLKVTIGRESSTGDRVQPQRIVAQFRIGLLEQEVVDLGVTHPGVDLPQAFPRPERRRIVIAIIGITVEVLRGVRPVLRVLRCELVGIAAEIIVGNASLVNEEVDAVGRPRHIVAVDPDAVIDTLQRSAAHVLQRV